MKPLIIIFLLLTAGAALAATTYRYECPKCHQIFEFGTIGVKKCPNDGWALISIPSK